MTRQWSGDLTSIRYFLAVAETMNFTQAAANCGIRQPTLTRAIGKLEEQLGGALFNRERSQTHLTELGRMILPHLKQCHDGALDIQALALEKRDGPQTALMLALSHTTPMSLVSGHIGALKRQAFPDLEVDFLRGTTTQIIEALTSGAAELAIAGPLGEDREHLDRFVLFEEDFALAVSESNICSALETIELSRLRDMKLLIRPYCEHHAELADILEHAGIAHQKALHISQDTDLIPLVRADMGVCIIPRSIATGYGFRIIAIEDFALRRSVSLHSVAGGQRTAAAGSLAGLLLSHNWQGDTSLGPSGTGPVAGRPQRVSPDHRLTA